MKFNLIDVLATHKFAKMARHENDAELNPIDRRLGCPVRDASRARFR
jgi:hypothetical protein